jgi:hypothetical protein
MESPQIFPEGTKFSMGKSKFTQKTYVVAFLPGNFEETMVGVHVRKLCPSNKNEIQCMLPKSDEKEIYEKEKKRILEGANRILLNDKKLSRSEIRHYKNQISIYSKKTPYGPFVAKKPSLGEKPILDMVLCEFIQLTVSYCKESHLRDVVLEPYSVSKTSPDNLLDTLRDSKN